MNCENLIIVGGTKGGTGKTTLALQIASFFAMQKNKVLIIDADLQATAYEWVHNREQALNVINVQTAHGRALPREIEKNCAAYDIVVCDIGGKANDDIANALMCGGVFLCPIQTSQFDISSLLDIKNTIERSNYPIEDTHIIFNRVHPTAKKNTPDEARGAILSFWGNINIASTYIHDRRAYNESAASSRSVWELPRKDHKAIGELEVLFSYLNFGD
jgi:chromosome partitioning protein